MAQTPLNGDLKVWVEKELIPFLFDHYGERDIGSITYDKRDFGSITDDANTMVEMLKTVEGNGELAAKIIHTVAMRQATQNLDPFLHALAFYPYNVAMLLIAHHKSRPNVSITELLERSGVTTPASGPLNDPFTDNTPNDSASKAFSNDKPEETSSSTGPSLPPPSVSGFKSSTPSPNFNEGTERSSVRGTSPIKSERRKRSNVEDRIEDVIDTQPLSARLTSRARDTERSPVERRRGEAD